MYIVGKPFLTLQFNNWLDMSATTEGLNIFHNVESYFLDGSLNLWLTSQGG